jgi:hypothetical protein
MRYAIIFSAGCLFFTGTLGAQDIPGLKTDPASGILVTSEKVYDGSSLYGYIDGGAELYLAYDFEHLLVQEVNLGKRAYTVQVYAMKDPLNAYGIYSLYRYRCLAGNVLTAQDCLTAYQYIACKQKYYYSIINETGDSLANVESLNLASVLLNKMQDIQLEWPAIFTIQPFTEHISSGKFIRGMTGLQQGMIDWSPWFEGLGTFSFWLLPIENNDGETVYLASIDFESDMDRAKFLKRSSAMLVNEEAPLPGQKVLAWKKGNAQVVFFDASRSNTDISCYVTAIVQEVSPPGRL